MELSGKKGVYCPELTDEDVLEMLARIFGVGVNVDVSDSGRA